MAEVKTVTVDASDDGVRLDRWLRRRWPHLGQAQIHRFARTGQLRVDGARARAETRLTGGARVRVPPLPEPPAAPENSPLDIEEIAFAKSLVLFEDNQVLILNKPAGVAVQGGAKTHRHIDRLLSAWGEGADRPRLVHRLDRDTSGLLALGKTASAAARLASAFAAREAEKTYWAIVEGNPNPAAGRIDLALAKAGMRDHERMIPVDSSHWRANSAITEFATVARSGSRAAWLSLRPLTGRTHQLRAHLLAMGHPILGDPKYHTAASKAASGSLRLQLHARRLILPHPSGGSLDVEAPVGANLVAGLAQFGFDEAQARDLPAVRKGKAK